MMTPDERLRARFELGQLETEALKRDNYKVRRYFPDTGPLRRELYPKHVAWMAGGAVHNERMFMAANRIGKTDCAAFELRHHLTGLYPHWWTGRRFEGVNRWWVAGDTMETTRNIPQVALLGPHDGVPRREWAGMVDAHLVTHHTRRSGGVANCIDTFWVRHVSGGESSVQFKAYDQGRRSFQGTELEGVWLDEEPPEAEDSAVEASSEIYTECLLRTMTTNGLIMVTATPLRGMTSFVSTWLENAVMLTQDGGLAAASQVFWPSPGDPAA